MAAKTQKAPQSLTITLDLSATYTDKRGHSMTLAQALDLFHGDVVKAIFLGAGKKAATTRDAARRSSGAAPSEMRLPGNLPPEVATMLDTVRQAIATAVPSMAPKSSAIPKAAPVPALDLSDPLETAVAQELAPEPPKAAPVPKARKPKAAKPQIVAQSPAEAALLQTAAALAAPATVIPAGVTRASARKAAKPAPKALKLDPTKAPTPDPKGDAIVAAIQAAQVAKVEAAPVPTVTPEIVKAAPPVVRTASGVKLPSNMDALRAKQAARMAAKQAAKQAAKV